MSSGQNNTEERRMSSINRRLMGAWLGDRLGRLFLSVLLLLLLVPAAYLGVREAAQFGGLSRKTERTFAVVRDEGGKAEELTYRAVTKDGQELVLNVLPELKGWLAVCGFIFLLRLLWLFALSFPEQRRRTARILAPINELAAKADELSRLEFGEDKYQLLEDAITQLDEGGRLSLRDSELMGIEAAVNNLLTRIRESNRQQARFVNDASHELRTPIAVIGGYADMLERWGKDDEKVLNESIAAIRTETARMKHLVEQLLFLARGDSGKTQLQLEEIDAGALLKEAYEESVMIDEDHVYRLQVSGEALTLQADQGLLKQAVRILLDNAAKYTAKGDEIILSCGRQEGQVYLQVQDTGIGMAEADVEHMFERFYRADEARSFEGTGLGLSIAKWIVDKHGGHFEIVSREELGTRIRIVL
ncbi:MAG: sensor histidine kinase [Lachnospiraceae bacterium]|nr:sensor histidine kinase [Lachnospiraceae bacterium]